MSASVRGDVERKELKAQWQAEVKVPEMSLDDVAKHNTKGDIWMAIHGEVYNVTEYLSDHPGGPEALLEVAGTDATTAFEDVGHSEDAREIMHQYLVGMLESAAQKSQGGSVKVIRTGPNHAEPEHESHLSQFNKAGYLGAVIGAIGILITFRPITHTISALNNAIGLKVLRNSDRGFLQGFFIATTTCGVAALALVKYLSKAADFNTPLSRYPSHLKVGPSAPAHHRPTFLKPADYQRLLLTKKEYLSPDVIRFTFQLPSANTIIGLPIGQHVGIRAHLEDNTVVSRSYTPTSNNSDIGKLELVIKIYSDGLLTGRYLSKLNTGDKVDFRGPKGAMRYRKGWTNKIGMVAGGTGITPMFQLIRAICEDETDLTQVSLLFANRTETDILLRDQLDRFAELYPKNFQVTYVLDKPGDGWSGARGYINKDLITKHLPKQSDDAKILLCGPPGMVNAVKGNLVGLGFKAPNAVSKMSDEIFIF